MEIESFAFGECSLRSLFLPASVSLLDGSAFLRSSIEKVIVDEGNSNFFVSGGSLAAFDGKTLVRHFGAIENVIVGPGYQILGKFCFAHCKMAPIAFEDGAGLREVGACAFLRCSALKSVCIPACVEVLGNECFAGCCFLSNFTFEPESRLEDIGISTFFGCSALASICIPGKVQSVPERCFGRCFSLARFCTEPGSQLAQIHSDAFTECYSLESIALPGSLEVVGRGAFRHCDLRCKLAIEVPSRIRQRDLPPGDFGHVAIPDSVEAISGVVQRFGRQNRVLQFGEGSALSNICLRQGVSYTGIGGNDVFLCLSEGAMRRLRVECG